MWSEMFFYYAHHHTTLLFYIVAIHFTKFIIYHSAFVSQPILCSYLLSSFTTFSFRLMHAHISYIVHRAISGRVDLVLHAKLAFDVRQWQYGFSRSLLFLIASFLFSNVLEILLFLCTSPAIHSISIPCMSLSVRLLCISHLNYGYIISSFHSDFAIDSHVRRSFIILMCIYIPAAIN